MDESHVITFRCPVPLLEKLDELAEVTHTSRSQLIMEAIRLFSEDIEANGGEMIPAYDDIDILKELGLDLPEAEEEEKPARKRSTRKKAASPRKREQS